MNYSIFFVNKAFKEVLHSNLLLNILEKKHDTFYQKQLDFFLVQYTFDALAMKCKDYFSSRDDIIYRDDEIILTNRVTGVTSSIKYDNHDLVVDAMTLDNPLVTFIYNCFRPVLIIEKAKVDEISLSVAKAELK